MEETMKIAIKLDRFSEEYDPYEYADYVDDPVQDAREILNSIRGGKTAGIINWLLQAADDPVEKENAKTVKALILALERIEKK